jgi:hypothetical protein
MADRSREESVPDTFSSRSLGPHAPVGNRYDVPNGTKLSIFDRLRS